jgi:polyisoprenoid-binding protein YceI
MTVRAIVASLLLAASQASPSAAQQDSLVYVLAPGSRFEVTAHKSGVFSFAGHEHLIRARSFAGRIVYFPSDPERSRLEIVVPSDSLEVLTPPDTEEIRKVTASMRTAVLDVAHYPEIRFESTALTRSGDGFHVTGKLTLVGKSQEVTVDVKTTAGPDTLRAAGAFEVKQTAFGIRPYRGGPGGLVRVADQVTFHFEAIGLRTGSN